MQSASHIRSCRVLFMMFDSLVRVEDDLLALEVTDDVVRVVSDHEIGEFLRAHLPHERGGGTCRTRKVGRANASPAPTRLSNWAGGAHLFVRCETSKLLKVVERDEHLPYKESGMAAHCI